MMPKIDIVLATKNLAKILEVKKIFVTEFPDFFSVYNLLTAHDVLLPNVVESGITFTENAFLKARAVSKFTGKIAIADDSGINVDVLGAAPGVFSARWAGKNVSDTDNVNLLLAQLADIPVAQRKASFVCAAAIVTPTGFEHVELGRLNGSLALQACGSNGFGYDSIMIPENQKRTCAQMSLEEKNLLSHRACAFKALLPIMQQIVSN